jgi:hypothetical protein
MYIWYSRYSILPKLFDITMEARQSNLKSFPTSVVMSYTKENFFLFCRKRKKTIEKHEIMKIFRLTIWLSRPDFSFKTYAFLCKVLQPVYK